MIKSLNCKAQAINTKDLNKGNSAGAKLNLDIGEKKLYICMCALSTLQIQTLLTLTFLSNIAPLTFDILDTL